MQINQLIDQFPVMDVERSVEFEVGGIADDPQRAAPGRLEWISLGQPFDVLISDARCDTALRDVLNTLREFTSGRLLLAFGCQGGRDVEERFKMGQAAAELANFTLITSDNPRQESPDEIADQIEEGFHCARFDGCRVELDRHRAINAVIRLAQRGDTVLIAGKGDETFQEFERTVTPFDDRVYARESLEALGYGSQQQS